MALRVISPCGRFSLPKLSVIFALLFLLYHVRNAVFMQSSVPGKNSLAPLDDDALQDAETPGTVSNDADNCLNAPGADRVMVVLKTGATELKEKLPAHLSTLFRCTPHYLIFSDVAQTFSDYQIRDALENVNPSYKSNHEDFELYRKLQRYHREGQNTDRLGGEQGWNLDRWKFMPMLHESFRLAPPGVDWFVYIEADTSLSWTNLLQWLARLDPSDKLYMGAQNHIKSVTFAHGGSGIVISRGAAKALDKKRRNEGPKAYDERWEALTSETCCGDETVARAFLEVGVPLSFSWPRIQGEAVSTLDWTENHWCAPAVTWHHVLPAQVEAMWQYSTQWVNKHGWTKPYLYKDVFDDMVLEHISANRIFWSNRAQDWKFVKPTTDPDNAAEAAAAFRMLSPVEQQSVESDDDCASACRSKDDCMQWMWSPGRCHLGSDVRLGHIDDLERKHGHEHAAEHWTSGWMLDRIRVMRSKVEPCKINWTH